MYAYLIFTHLCLLAALVYIRRPSHRVTGTWCTVYLRRWFSTTEITLPVEVFAGINTVKATWTGPEGTKALQILAIKDNNYTNVIGIPTWVPNGCSLTLTVNDIVEVYGPGSVDLTMFYDQSAWDQK